MLRDHFPASAGYLDTATCGLPSRDTLAAVQEHLRSWSDGTGSLELFHEPVERSRALFAQLVGVDAGRVTITSQVSPAIGVVAGSLPAGTRVVLAEGDFTSVLWPFLAREDLRCTVVPLDRVVDTVADGCDWVAVSTVQSSSGEVLDVDALRGAADAGSARVLLDATQSLGWLPLDAGRFDVVTAGAYKWLLSPRGSAFTSLAPDLHDELRPTAAGWYAGDDVATSYYGAPARLAPDARRFDVSPSWIAYAGTAPALQQLLDVGVERVHAHDVGLANAFRSAVGLEPSDSAVVSLAVDADALRAAGVRCSGRAGRARLAFHLYNDEDDVELAARAVRGCRAPA